MKRGISLIIVMLMVFLSPAYALNETNDSVLNITDNSSVLVNDSLLNESIADPGTTPDSFFYFLDLAMEELSLAFTFNEEAKIRKELEFAEERLAEARAMALEGNIEAMKKAEENHEKLLLNIKQKINETNQTEIKVKVEEHLRKIEVVNNELKIKVKAKGDFTEEDLAFIDEMIRKFGNRSGELEIEIEREQEREQEMEQETEQERHGQDDNESEIGEGEGHSNRIAIWDNETNDHHNENANHDDEDDVENASLTDSGGAEEGVIESDSGGGGEGANDAEDDNGDSGSDDSDSSGDDHEDDE